MIGIYRIVSPTHKIYIGQSWDIEKRVKYYKIGDCKRQRKLKPSIEKYGWNNHQFQVMIVLNPEVANQQELDRLEIYYMNVYRSMGYELLNLREGGSRGKWSNEQRENQSKRVSGKNNPMYGRKRPDTSAWNKKIKSEQMKGDKNPMFGKTHTPEVRLILSEAGKKAIITEENRENLRKRMSGKGNPMFGRKRPDTSLMNSLRKGKKYKKQLK